MFSYYYFYYFVLFFLCFFFKVFLKELAHKGDIFLSTCEHTSRPFLRNRRKCDVVFVVRGTDS